MPNCSANCGCPAKGLVQERGRVPDETRFIAPGDLASNPIRGDFSDVVISETLPVYPTDPKLSGTTKGDG